jgi:hypothetical protein
MVGMLRKISIAVLLTLVATAANTANADVLFEGYSKVMLAGVHVGFVVQKYEFDSQKKEFATTYYLRTNAAGGNLTESLKARASASLAPISYQYTTLVGDQAKTIDATMKGETLTVVTKEGSSAKTTSKKIPKGSFFASFLAYVMLQGPEGVKTGAKYGYQAIAEEDGALYTGEAYVNGEETIRGVSAFKVLNTFKGSRFISFVTHKGEVVETRSPVQQIETQLVSGMPEASAGLSVNTSNLSLLFGGIPKGSENVVARKGAAPSTGPSPSAATGTAGEAKKKMLDAAPAPTGEGPKKDGVAGGQGIVIKPSSNPTPSR